MASGADRSSAANGDSGRTVHPRPARPPRLTAADFTPERMLRPKAQATGRRLAPRGLRRFRRSGRGRTQRGRTASARARRAGQDADHRLPQGRVRLAQGRRRQDDDLPSRGPHVRLASRRPGRRARREPGRGNARVPAAARDRRDDRDAPSRPRGDRQVRRRPRLQLPGVEPARGDRGRRALEIADAIESAAVGQAVGLLERHYNLVCLDTAAGVLGSAAQGVLEAADQLVIVSRDEPRRRARRELDARLARGAWPRQISPHRPSPP